MQELDLDSLKKLAGITPPVETRGDGFGPMTGSEKARIMKEHNIKPGTDAWFRLWFARPQLTGESNFDK
jgi:hypothetical protein